MNTKIIGIATIGVTASLAVGIALSKNHEKENAVPAIFRNSKPSIAPHPAAEKSAETISAMPTQYSHEQKKTVHEEEKKTHGLSPDEINDEELKSLKGEEKQEVVAASLSNFEELEQLAEVQNVKCESKSTSCTIEIKSKTTNTDSAFQMAMLRFHSMNYKLLGTKSSYDTTKSDDGQTIQYTYSLEETK